MAVHKVLLETFGISHATVQIEDETCSDRLEEGALPTGSGK
jgi:hypothetical protein